MGFGRLLVDDASRGRRHLLVEALDLTVDASDLIGQVLDPGPFPLLDQLDDLLLHTHQMVLENDVRHGEVPTPDGAGQSPESRNLLTTEASS